jgi:hypothetical protein
MSDPSLINASRRSLHAAGTNECAGEAVSATGKSVRSSRSVIRSADDLGIQQYQQDIFTELRAEDELVILARGLGLLHLITNLLHFYDAAGNNLVLVVGADDRENEWIGEGRSGPSVGLQVVRRLYPGTHSTGGALCDQQVSACSGIEGDQY